MKKTLAIALAGTLLIPTTLNSTLEERILTTSTKEVKEVTTPTETRNEEQSRNYSSLLQDIRKKQQEFQEIYFSSKEKREETLDNVKEYLFRILTTDIFPEWYGTQWDFNGTTREPKTGAIACGYFITTTIQDAGFRIQRVKLAQQPASLIIKNLSERSTIRQFSNATIEEFATTISAQGPGLYIVGLDCHVGFIVNNGKDLRFVHSNYYRPKEGVVSEPLEGNNPLANSKYRISGKILGNKMIERWVKGERLPMQHTYQQ